MVIKPTYTVEHVLGICPDAARAFSKLGIDFCSEGHLLIRDACTESGVSFRRLLREISKTLAFRETDKPDLSTISIEDLIGHIETYHHQFAAESILFVNTSLSRLARMHGNAYPELAELKSFFDEISGPLMVHMQHEEFIVFPYIRELVKKQKRVRKSIYKSVDSPIPGMLNGHEKGPEYFKRLNNLTHRFSPPSQARAFQVTYEAMRELERDLATHLRLESEILYPRAIELEIKVNISAQQKLQPSK